MRRLKMNDEKLPRPHLLLLVVLGFGCSIASFSGTLLSMGTANAAPAGIITPGVA
jgi:hypothetical protein